MKKLISLFIFALLMLSACITTNVYPGEKEGRTYESQNTRVCETLKFECEDYEIPFNDYTGCGCELVEDYEPTIEEPVVEEPSEPVEELVEDPVLEIECGIIDDEQISCDEGMCAFVEGKEKAECIPDDFCDDYCEEGLECIILESYPVQIRCSEIVEELEEIPEEEVVIEEKLPAEEDVEVEEEVSEEESVISEIGEEEEVVESTE